jgi:GT2 family glycosyltransferase
LTRQDFHGVVSFGPKGFIQVKGKHSINKKVSIIIIIQENLKTSKKSLKSLLAKTILDNIEILLIVSKQMGLAKVEHLVGEFNNPLIRCFEYKGEYNIAKMKNFAVELATGEILIFLDNNLEVIDSDWLEEMIGWASQKKIGAVGGKILNPNGTIRRTGLLFEQQKARYVFSGVKEYFGVFGSSEWYRNFMALPGSWMATRKGLFEKMGKFDGNSSKDYYNVEFCLRLRKHGYRIAYSPYARAKIIEPSGSEDYINDHWSKISGTIPGGDFKKEDPYFNRNLFLNNSIPQIN